MSGSDPRAPERIADRLRGRHLLVTGATGLLAKVFVEKLLRSVPEIGGIHLLVRRRRSDGLTSEQRVQREVLGSSVFDRLRALLGPRFDGLCREKIRVVGGDLTEDRFGLSDEAYRSLTETIDIVVNSAATVTFDERLDLARSLNTQGPLRLLNLARDCGNAPFLQVSTCYVSGRRTGDTPETIAEPPDGTSIDLDVVLEEMKQTCDDIITTAGGDGDALRRKLVDAGMEFAHRHGWNDTYTFTKWVGEKLVDRERGDVPVVILRPAIIEGSLREPVPGWIDGLRMADPMIIAYGRGRLTEFPGDLAAPIDIIPVDLVANAMVAAMQAPGSPPGLEIYHVGSSARNTMRVREMVGYLEEGFLRRPMLDDDDRPIRVGRFGIVTLATYHKTWRRRLGRALWYRRLLSRLNAKPARRRQLTLAIAQIEQLIYFANIYTPYTQLNCRFLDDRLQALAASLHPDDRRTFSFDATVIDWREYIVNRHISGLRKFVLSSSRGGQRPIPLPGDLMPQDINVRASFQEAETIFDAFDRIARLAGEKVALQMKRRGRWVRYTYEEAHAATATIVRRFAEFGLKPGDRVALCGENCPAWGLIYLAAMRAGLTAVPLDPQLPADDLLDGAAFTGAKLFCAGSSLVDAVRSAAEARSGESPSLPIVEMAEPFVPPPGASRDEPLPGPTNRPSQVASILFTSGTTVAPKAVQLSHANFLANARGIVKAQPLGARDNFLSVLPLHHAFEFTAGFVIPLTAGSTITYVEQLKGPAVAEAMQATRTTVMLVVPRLLSLFHESIRSKVRSSGAATRLAFRVFGGLSDLSGGRLGKTLFRAVHRQFGGHLRLFVSGGSALDPELHRAFGRLGFVVAEGYGLTETAPVVAVNPPDGGKAGSVGPGLPGVDLEIRDPNPDGIGELWIRGPNVMQSYLDDPKATAAVLRDGWYRTGDLCRFDKDNYLYIMGRVTDTIVTDSGKNVYPDEVEARYRDLPCVKEICVLGVPNAGGTGESVHAVIVPDFDKGSEYDPSTLERTIRETVSHVGETVPSHQRIQTVHFWRRELPKTSTLKARRGEIRTRLLEGRDSASPRPGAGTRDGSGPASTADWTLTAGQRHALQVLARVSHKPVSVIRPESSLLLDLGMDSLMKLYAVAELESEFQARCPDHVAAGMSRVKDVLVWIGDRKPEGRPRREGSGWRSRLHRESPGPATGQAGLNGRPAGPFRWLARGSLALFFSSYVRVRSEGLRNIPASGPFVLAANHASHLDSGSVLKAVGGRRRVWVAAAADYFFDTRLKRWVFGRLFDAIPMDRYSEGITGMRRCIEVLGRGDGLLVLPEGTRSTTGRIQPFKTGVAVMAVEAGAPVVPVRIEHAFDLLPKGRRIVRPGVVRVTFGEPVDPDPFRGGEDLDEQYRLYREMAALIQTAVEGLGGGRGAAK